MLKKRGKKCLHFLPVWHHSHLPSVHWFQQKVPHNPLILHSVVRLTSHLSPIRARRATLHKHHPLNPAAFSADSLIPGCNRIWDRQHEDLANPLLRTSVILLKILCIHTRLNTVATAKVKRIDLTESDLMVFPKRKDLELVQRWSLTACKRFYKFKQKLILTI